MHLRCSLRKGVSGRSQPRSGLAVWLFGSAWLRFQPFDAQSFVSRLLGACLALGASLRDRDRSSLTGIVGTQVSGPRMLLSLVRNGRPQGPLPDHHGGQRLAFCMAGSNHRVRFQLSCWSGRICFTTRCNGLPCYVCWGIGSIQ